MACFEIVVQHFLVVYIYLSRHLGCSIAVYFYESCSILASLKGESTYK